MHVVIDLLGWPRRIFEPTAATALDCVLKKCNVDEVVDTVNRNYLDHFRRLLPASTYSGRVATRRVWDYYQLKQSGFFEFATTTTCYGRYEGSGTATVKSISQVLPHSEPRNPIVGSLVELKKIQDPRQSAGTR